MVSTSQKEEFQDALCLRYDMRLKNLPSICPSDKEFNVTNALNCHRGSFIDVGHDNVKLLKAKIPVTSGNYPRSAMISDEARPDIRARGF